MIFGFVFFFIAGFGLVSTPDPPRRFNLIALGLACWILANILMQTGVLGK